MRFAGRGTSLRVKPPQQRPTLGRDAARPEAPRRSAGRGTSASAHERMSALATSVLRRTGGVKTSNNWRSSMESSHSRDRKRRVASRRPVESRHKPMTDWYSSAERTEALQQFKLMTSTTTSASDAPHESPFAWGNVATVLAELPPGHWATSYVENVAYTLEANPAISARDKQTILNETLSTLSALSQINAREASDAHAQDERFCDA